MIADYSNSDILVFRTDITNTFDAQALLSSNLIDMTINMTQLVPQNVFTLC